MKNPTFFVQNNLVDRLTVPVARYARDRGYRLEDRSSVAGFDVDNCGIDWSKCELVIPMAPFNLFEK